MWLRISMVTFGVCDTFTFVMIVDGCCVFLFSLTVQQQILRASCGMQSLWYVVWDMVIKANEL